MLELLELRGHTQNERRLPFNLTDLWILRRQKCPHLLTVTIYLLCLSLGWYSMNHEQLFLRCHPTQCSASQVFVLHMCYDIKTI